MAVDNTDHKKSKLSRIMEDVRCWMYSKQLKLNEDKPECLIIGTVMGRILLTPNNLKLPEQLSRKLPFTTDAVLNHESSYLEGAHGPLSGGLGASSEVMMGLVNCSKLMPFLA